ncbi:MAG: prolyl oligopeptidase family serine peptidase [Clostridia bacterium]|nr:prolyl oligopeptidase family serine peptidase [Clostridia bacterium]
MSETMYFTSKINKSVSFKALVTTPPDFDPAKERLPMIVFLHGAGERGDDFDLLCSNPIPKLFAADPCWNGLRVITFNPQCAEDQFWTRLTAEVHEAILEAAEKYNADPDRISITGLSMGGYGTWDQLCAYPDMFSAAAPVCGGGVPWLVPDNIPTPIRAFHGENDDVVDPSESRKMVDAVNSRGGHASLTTFMPCDHASWGPAYETTDVVSWLANSVKTR